MSHRACWWVVSGLVVMVAAAWPSGAAGEAVSQVAGGGSHTCAVAESGAAWCWGSNSYGQLGDGTNTSRSTPGAVSGLASGVVALAAGYYHTCALTSAGAVWCWGRGNYGQLGNGSTSSRNTPVAVSSLAGGVAAIAAGDYHTCAMTSAGAAFCWGRNDHGQLGDETTTNRSAPVPVTGFASGAAALDAGGHSTCAVTAVGGLWCWGYNSYGQVGDGTTTDRLAPVVVSGLASGVASVATGAYHTCARTSAGAATCWGYNVYGELGDGTTTTFRPTPVAVSGLGSGVAALAVGVYHTCALTSAGGAWCWGNNELGQLGDGSMTIRTVPTAVSGLGSGVTAIAAGNYHTSAVIATGGVWCWGWDDGGELGNGGTLLRTTPAVVVGVGGTPGQGLAVGSLHNCVIITGGSVSCWGGNSSGQLGDGTYVSRAAPSGVVGLGSGAVTVTAGDSHTCAVTGAGALSCWGYNYYGQVGDGTTEAYRRSPVAVSGLGSGVVEAAAGAYHTCALTTGGALQCWGRNQYGQLGDGTTTDRSTPVAVSGLASGVVAIATGYSHTCAATDAGAVWCWGQNSNGQLGDGTTTDRLTPVAVSGLPGAIQDVSVGYMHSCAVTSLGAAWCWGYNVYGQLGDGTTTSRPSAVAVSGLGSGVTSLGAGDFHTCAVTSAGAASCWGYNYYGQLGDGTTSSRYTPTTVSGLGSGAAAADGGGAHSCAVIIAGTVWCWGYNTTGQLGDGRVLQQLSPVPTLGLQPARADVGRDGRSDLVWHHATGGDVWVWPMNGTVPVSQTYLATVADTGWQIRGLGDQTGDGRADLLWRHATSGALFLWAMNGTSVTAQTYLGAVVPDYAIVGTADYTGDGRSDILWRHQTTGALWLWRMNGATLEAVTAVATIDPAFAVVASGDLNGDGRADLLWRHETSGDVWVWLMNGAVPTSQVHLGAVADLGYHVVGLADHDRDGRADVLWHHVTSGDVWLWRMNGTTITAITHVATVGDPDYRVVGVGDYDGDAKADVLWHHATTGALWVWLMNGAVISSATWVATVPDVGYQVVNSR